MEELTLQHYEALVAACRNGEWRGADEILENIISLVFQNGQYKPLAKFDGARWLLDELLSSFKESIDLRDHQQCKSVVRALKIAINEKEHV